FFTLHGLRLALLICYDAEFPEAVRGAAREGAQAIIVPTALADRWQVVATRVMPARAFENGVYLVYANHAGREGDITYVGASCIRNPDGEDIARAGAMEELILGSLCAKDVFKAQARLPYLKDLHRLLPSIEPNLANVKTESCVSLGAETV